MNDCFRKVYGSFTFWQYFTRQKLDFLCDRLDSKSVVSTTLSKPLNQSRRRPVRVDDYTLHQGNMALEEFRRLGFVCTVLSVQSNDTAMALCLVTHVMGLYIKSLKRNQFSGIERNPISRCIIWKASYICHFHVRDTLKKVNACRQRPHTGCLFYKVAGVARASSSSGVFIHPFL